MGLALDLNLKFYTRMAKRLILNARKFWGPIPTFVEVTGNKTSRASLPPHPPILNRVKRFFAFYVVIKKYLIIFGRNLNRSLVSDWDIVIHKTSNRKSKFHQILKHSRQLKKNFQKSQAYLPPSCTNFSKSVLKIITKMILLNYMFLHIDVWQEHTKDRIY